MFIYSESIRLLEVSDHQQATTHRSSQNKFPTVAVGENIQIDIVN